MLDYEHFARTFAGIGKVSAVALPSAAGSIVHLTIAGERQHPDRRPLRSLPEPGGGACIASAIRSMSIVRSCALRAEADRPRSQRRLRGRLPLGSRRAADSRARCSTRFGFKRQGLGQDVRLSEIVQACIHGIRGVTYVDVDVLDAIEEASPPTLRSRAAVEELAKAEAAARPPARIVAEMAIAGPSAARSDSWCSAATCLTP